MDINEIESTDLGKRKLSLVIAIIKLLLVSALFIIFGAIASFLFALLPAVKTLLIEFREDFCASVALICECWESAYKAFRVLFMKGDKK